MDADELRDFENQDPHIPRPSAADLGPYARFLQNLPDYNDMTQEEFDKAFEAQDQRRSCESLWQTCAWPGVST